MSVAADARTPADIFIFVVGEHVQLGGLGQVEHNEQLYATKLFEITLLLFLSFFFVFFTLDSS